MSIRSNVILFSLLFLNSSLFALNTIQQQIDQAIADGKSSVTILPGTYLVNETLRIIDVNKNNFSIFADGVIMIQDGRRQHILVRNCTNISIKGITLDHDQGSLPFTQATITGYAADWSTLEAKIHASYPQDPSARSKVEVYEAETGKLIPNVWTEFDVPIEKLTDDTVRLTGIGAYEDKVEIGDKIVLDCPTSKPHGIIVEDSKNCTFENITLHTSTSFGIFETDSEGNHYLGIKITPGPTPTLGDEPRLRSMNADGIHSKHATLGPRIENCLIESLGDDAIAINGDYDLIIEAEENIVVIASKRDTEIQVGDTVRSFSTGGVQNFETIVEAIEAKVPTTEYTDALNAIKVSRPNLQNPDLFKDFYELTLAISVAATPGDSICASDRKGNGFIVRNNTIRNKRARGILIKAEDGVIEGNTIEDNHMGAIVLAPELNWLEAGFSRSVQIRNNRIKRSGINASMWSTIQAGVITVAAESGSAFAPAGGHLDIEITGNRIDSSLGANILATSVTGLTIQDNVMVNTHSEPRDHGRNRGVDPEAAVVLINCENVTLNRNIVSNLGGTKFLAATNLANLTGSDTFAYEPAIFSNFQLLYEIGGPATDYDQDQIPNFLEYVYGLDPTSKDAIAPLLSIQADSSEISLFFLSPKEKREDVKMEIQKSSTLDSNDWTTIAYRDSTGAWSGSDTLNTTPNRIYQELEQIEISETIFPGEPCFYRIQAEQIMD